LSILIDSAKFVSASYRINLWLLCSLCSYHKQTLF